VAAPKYQREPAARRAPQRVEVGLQSGIVSAIARCCICSKSAAGTLVKVEISAQLDTADAGLDSLQFAMRISQFYGRQNRKRSSAAN
jgi:hypothetical protein